jgi:hypothetical protein
MHAAAVELRPLGTFQPFWNANLAILVPVYFWQPSCAIAQCGKIVQIQPANLVALNNLALDLAEAGNPDEGFETRAKGR